MSRMNGHKNPFQPDTQTTTNHEGHTVHRLDALETLFSKVMGSFFGESTFYEPRDAYSAFDEVRELINAIPEEHREYALKIAMLGRQMGMIQYPLAILTACFNVDSFKGQNFLDASGRNAMYQYADQIVLRGKDIVDVMTYQMKGIGCEATDNGRNIPLPMQLRKCMKSKLEHMTDYTLSKGLCVGHEVSMADCIKMLRPNPRVHELSGGRHDFYNNVLNNRVSFADGVPQVQTELVKYGQGKPKNAVEFAMTIKNTPVLAVLKNLVAIHRAFGFDNGDILKALRNKFSPESVAKSKVLPFRFYSAYKEVANLYNVYSYNGVDEVLHILELALDVSVNNITSIDGYNAILIDRSLSMNKAISSRSNVTANDVACLLGAIVLKRTHGDVYVFGTRAMKLPHINGSATSVLNIMRYIRQHDVGSGTYIDRALDLVQKSGAKYNNLIVLTDGDVYCETPYGFTFSDNASCVKSCNDLVNQQMRAGVYRRVFVNNLMGNNFSIVNVADNRKNLVVGFTEKFVDMINLYADMSRAGNIRNLIDGMLLRTK